MNPTVKLFILSAALLAGSACTTSPPSNTLNVCDIFEEKKGWYKEAAKSRKEWGSPISTMMAIMYQESRFEAKARPPRKKILGFIPGPRPASAYGYTQALDETWEGYKRSAGRYGADRDDFADSVDFVGWYNDQSSKRSGISKSDTYRLYLAYHEGQGGYNRGTYNKKQWLKDVAAKVNRRANDYKLQLQGCEKDLKKRKKFLGIF